MAEASVAFSMSAGANQKMLDGFASDQEKAIKLAHFHQVPIQGGMDSPGYIAITGGAGGPAYITGPSTGYCWGIRRINLSGYTAGTVTIFRNANNGEILIPSTPAGTFTFGRSEMLLMGDENLVLTATGITLAAGFAGIQVAGNADYFPQWLLPRYLGGF